MREVTRNVEHQSIACGQLYADRFFEGRGVLSEIDDHIVNGPAGATNNLGLAVRRHLIVHSSKRPLFLVEGNVALGQARLKPAFDKLLLGPGAREKSAFVLELLQFKEEGAGKLCFLKDHRP